MGTQLLCTEIINNIWTNQTMEIFSIFLGLVVLFFGQIRA